eukprot:TRINITY_DN7398_c0_g1_i1.p1 TRINITY_DN7398_c0_g1~~TRINITY_DN7398_c0_g1_i1.p1  ORF type:complete len:314 (+),score=40.26 TRINITY_DN7398_c0_g1_i1:115-1056(+)
MTITSTAKTDRVTLPMQTMYGGVGEKRLKKPSTMKMKEQTTTSAKTAKPVKAAVRDKVAELSAEETLRTKKHIPHTESNIRLGLAQPDRMCQKYVHSGEGRVEVEKYNGNRPKAAQAASAMDYHAKMIKAGPGTPRGAAPTRRMHPSAHVEQARTMTPRTFGRRHIEADHSASAAAAVNAGPPYPRPPTGRARVTPDIPAKGFTAFSGAGSNRAESPRGRRHHELPPAAEANSNMGIKVFSKSELASRTPPPQKPRPQHPPQKEVVATIYQHTQPAPIMTAGTGERGAAVHTNSKKCQPAQRWAGNGNILTWG